ncbi:hypothetical protein C8F01DRAFT_1257088 [Mycena amicta]|nr:hypothetical protein C8F01DRAFT_1257088 [Mycena amicta]
MSLSRLLKKLSEKSLKSRKRNQSTTSAVDQEQAPIPKTVASGTSSEKLISGKTTETLDGSHHSTVVASLDKSTPPTPILDRYVSNSPTPLPSSPAIEGLIPQDKLSIALQPAWKSANTAQKVSKGDKTLERVENGVTVVQNGLNAVGGVETIENGVAGVKTGLDAIAASGVEAFEKGLHAFMQGMPVLINALDEVAKLHPYVEFHRVFLRSVAVSRFIAVVVLTFKTVWSLEQKRRNNDKKILMLYMEMKDMMGALLQLKSVKDPSQIAPDGSTIAGRMQGIVESTVQDIKDCANACDTYARKKLIVKVLKGPIWEGKLADFAGVFTKRRSDFQFAMSIHITVAVDAANRGIGVVDERTQAMDERTQAMDEKIDIVIKMFAQMVSPEQKEMSRLIDQKGGAACLDNDETVKELIGIENEKYSTRGAGGAWGAKAGNLANLKKDLETTPDEAMEENAEKFSGMFVVQQRQIIVEILGGPHDRIKDPHVYALWKEMRWRGHVKTDEFVMALRDQFQEDYNRQRASEQKTDSGEHKDNEKPDNAQEFVPPIAKEDEWTLGFINIVHLQAISEAFDGDFWGHVNVNEINAFTTARPVDWSILQWMAYWAVGHHQTMQVYTNKINELLGKMFAILPLILPANKAAVNGYLNKISTEVYSLTAALNYCPFNTALQVCNLEAVKYAIDTRDTLELVTGEGRIERYVLPVMYLLLKRHFEIFRVCQTHIIHAYELWDALRAMEWVFQPVYARVKLLQSSFKQRNLDVQQQFKSFSFGLYECMNMPTPLRPGLAKVIQEGKFGEYTYDESIEEALLDVEKITHYPLDEEPLDFVAYALPSRPSNLDTTVEVLPAFTSLLSAHWHGFIYNPPKSLYPAVGMVSMTLKPTLVEGEVQHFDASERGHKADFEITGECRIGEDPNKVLVTFKRTFPARFATQHYNGIWDVVTNTLSGTLGFKEDVSTHFAAFMFRQVAPEYACFMPAPVQLNPEAKSRALWSFAISAVRFQVRRERWFWSFFKERRDNRKRFIELHIRSGAASTQFGKPLDSDERKELSRFNKSFTTQDSRWLYSLAERQIRTMTDHSVACDSCAGLIGGARVICLVCQNPGTVDFDESPSCFAGRVMRNDMQRPHLPHHDLIKLRRVLHIREFGKTFRNAREALQRARAVFKAAGIRQFDAESDTKDERDQALASNPVSQLAITIPDAAALPPLSAVSDAVATKGPRCANCTKPCVIPCWLCVQCSEETFICWDCDAKGEFGISTLLENTGRSHHFHTHDLVRVQEAVEEDFTLEVFRAHERKMEERMRRMEERTIRVEERTMRMEEQMMRVEGLLEKIVAAAGVQQ